MKFSVISLFPEMFTALDCGITGRALKSKLIEICHHNPRDFTEDARKTVDDRPYGGGPGMVMLAEPIYRAIESAKITTPKAKVIYLSPQGKPLNHQEILQLATYPELILLTGRYEGIDQRVIDDAVDMEYSIGDFVLSGGELPAMCLIDAITRQIPGALGHADAATEDSFATGILDWPHYTRPDSWHGHSVPEVLKSGDHKAINEWRQQQALGKTWQNRPDLIKRRILKRDDNNNE